MRLSIKGTAIDYSGHGCYNLQSGGGRLTGGHLHNDGKNGIEYVDLEGDEWGPTHEVDMPTAFPAYRAALCAIIIYLLGIFTGVLLVKNFLGN